MSITTMEALQGVAVGSRLTATDGSGMAYTVAEGGLAKDGFTIPFDQFLGMVERGVLREGVPFRTGQWWSSRRGWVRWVTNVENGKADMVEFSTNGAYRAIYMQQEDQTGLTLQDNAPTNFDAAMATNWASYLWSERYERDRGARREQEALQRHREELQRNQEAFSRQRNDLNDKLLEHLEDNEDDGLVEIMREAGMRLPEETVEVTIDVSGMSTHYVDSETLQPYVPEGCNVSSGTDVRIDWERTVTYEVSVPVGECGCDHIGRSEVQSALRAVDVTDWYDLDWSLTCSNC